MPKPKDNAAAQAARKRAEVTPPLVLDAMLARPVTACGLTLHPLSLDIIWTLQACRHPAFDSALSAESEMTALQIAQLIYAFASPGEAVANAPQGDGGQSLFDSEAFAFFRRHLTMSQVGEVVALIARLIKAGYAPAPNPAKAGPA